MKSFRRPVVGASVLVAALLLSACAQDSGDDAADAGSDDAASEDAGDDADDDAPAASGDAPAPFDSGDATIAIVQQSGAGDYFQQFLNGTRQQAELLGVSLDVYDAQGDDATQATQLDQAIASSPDGIIVRHGLPDTMCPGINDAIEAGIPVVVYDIEIRECAPDAVQSQQSDALMASLVLDQMLEDVGADVPVGYVNVLGIAPLDRRHAVWEDYKAEHGWDELFMTGTFTNSTATDTAPMVDNSLRANDEVVAIYSPYDEFAKGVLSALEQQPELQDRVLVYAADISTADIELMVADGSPWVATGATDPNAIGAAIVRTLALHMAGELGESLVEIPPILITQDFLRDNGITNMDELRAQAPELSIGDVSSADWIESAQF
ncbi:MAG: substrate-binding domain-containing protein [Nitriliruptoraceae bacterium]|nr:substrate-binding domain-containing protein [Nitriliruptoraceae bacterium]